MKNVIVIGGGPAGMIAAGVAAESGKCVTLLEKNNKLGKKLYITGKGRCNVTNVCDIDEFLNNTPSNPYFLYSSLYSFDCNSTIDFFEKLDVPIKVERGNRAYPASDKASDIVKALEKYMNKNKVTVKCYSQVKKLIIG